MLAQGSRATRRLLLQGAIAGLAGISLGPQSRMGEHAHAEPATLQPPVQPNILLILTDDMRVTDLPYLPAVQALLVQQGATFTNFSTTAP